jgi:hypothetical protein
MAGQGGVRHADGVTATVERAWLTEVLWPATLGGVFFGPTAQVVDVLGFGDTWNWREVLLQAVLFVAGAGLFVVAQLYSSAGARERAAVGRAVSTGTLPAQAGGEWLDPLTAERGRLQLARAGVPAVTTLLVLSVAVTALLPEGPGGRGWLLCVGLALVGGLATVRQRRHLQAAVRLQTELEARLTST